MGKNIKSFTLKLLLAGCVSYIGYFSTNEEITQLLSYQVALTVMLGVGTYLYFSEITDFAKEYFESIGISFIIYIIGSFYNGGFSESDMIKGLAIFFHWLLLFAFMWFLNNKCKEIDKSLHPKFLRFVYFNLFLLMSTLAIWHNTILSVCIFAVLMFLQNTRLWLITQRIKRTKKKSSELFISVKLNKVAIAIS